MAENKIDRREFVERSGLGGLGTLVALALGSASCYSTEGEELRGNYSGTGTITKVRACESGCGRFKGVDMIEISVRHSLPGKEGSERDEDAENIESKLVGPRLSYGGLAEGQKVTVNFGRVYEVNVVGGISQRRERVPTDSYRLKSIEAQSVETN